jgi:hypothetical protein
MFCTTGECFECGVVGQLKASVILNSDTELILGKKVKPCPEL